MFVLAEEEAADPMETMETKYTDIIIYACGFLALIMAVIIVVLCRMQVQPRREPFDALPVQKLSKFPLRRQVRLFEEVLENVFLAISSIHAHGNLFLLVLGGVQLIGEVQRLSDEGGTPLVQLLPHAGRSHGV